jgi:hypothetical protein
MAWAQSWKVTTKPESNPKDGGRIHEQNGLNLTIAWS